MKEFKEYLEEVQSEGQINEGIVGDILKFPLKILFWPIAKIIGYLIEKNLSTKRKIDILVLGLKILVNKSVDLEILESESEFTLSKTDKEKLEKLRQQNPKEVFEKTKKEYLDGIQKSDKLSEDEKVEALEYSKKVMNFDLIKKDIFMDKLRKRITG